MKALVVSPIVRYHDQPRHVPLGILQLLAILERDHPRINFVLYDANAFRVDDPRGGRMPGLDEVLAADRYDVMAIGGLVTGYNYIKAAMARTRELQPEAEIIAGGGFFTALPTDMMELLPIDYGVVGEAYETFPALLEALDRGEVPEYVDGLVYRRRDSFEFTRPRALIRDLDWLPFPAYRHAPLDIYFRNSGILMSEEAMKAKKRLDYNFSLSCPFACKFSVTGDTRVPTFGGLIPISELAEPKQVQVCPHGHAVKSADVQIGSPTGDIIRVVDEGYMPVHEVRLRNGFRLKCTENHKLLVAKNGNLHWTEVKAIKPGNYVALSRRGQSPPSGPFLSWKPYRSRNPWALARSTRLPTEMVADLGWLVGFLIGDGSIHRDGRRLTFAVDDYCEAKLRDICRRLFGIEIKVYKHSLTTKIRQAWIHNTVMVDFLCQVTGLSPSEKHKVPEVIFESSRETGLAFIEGLWDADAYTPGKGRYQDYLTTVSKRLADEVALLLQNLGSGASISTVRRPDGKQIFRVFRLPFRSDPIPTGADAYWSGKDKVRFRLDSKRHRRGKEEVTLRRSTLEKIDPAHPLLAYWYSQVLSVDYAGVERVWDVTVPESDCFVANGIMAHNCWDLGITSNLKYVQREGRVEPENGRPTRNSVVRQHSPRYVASLVEHLRKDFMDVTDVDRGIVDPVPGYPVDFVAWFDENIVAHDAQTGFTWLESIRDELWKRDLVADCVKAGRAHDPKTCSGIHMGGTSHAGLATPRVLKTMREIGFTYCDYGLESWDRGILQDLGKGASPERNANAIKLTLEAGMAPIPNQIIGFPLETWETIYGMLEAWEKTGIATVPFLMTPYPGSQWFTEYREEIVRQYGGDLERFIMDLEDATKVTAVINKKFTPTELVGIQAIMGMAAKTRDFDNARRLLGLSRRRSQSGP